MSFDILNAANLTIEETAEMVLVHPVTGLEMYADNDETKPIKFTLIGTSNPKHRKAVEALMRAKNKRGKREPTVEESREDSINFLVALSVKVDNMDYGGRPITSPEVFKELYSNEKLSWVRDQVSNFLAVSDNFIKA